MEVEVQLFFWGFLVVAGSIVSVRFVPLCLFDLFVSCILRFYLVAILVHQS